MKISIIGRPNVGKSTLFNRLAGRKLAIVNDSPGVTRDRKSVDVDLFGLKFSLLDTPGVDVFTVNDISLSMNKQSFAAIEESDVILFAIDSIEGITNYDKEIANWIRGVFKKVGNRIVIVIKNKSDSKKRIEFGETVLGFGEGISVSAEQNSGFNTLYDELMSKYSEIHSNCDADGDAKNISLDDDLVDVKVAIVGRPNVGKSTIINAILGEDRLNTGPEAGITRDAIILPWKYKNKTISLIDTAGQRRKSKVEDDLESLSVLDAWRYIRQANVVVVVMDIQNPFEKQDLTIARKAFDEGKIIIFVLNKSDTVSNPDECLKKIQIRAEKEFAQLPGVKCLLVSAIEKKGLARIFNVALELYNAWNMRISTGILNKWFASAMAQKSPPLVNGYPIKLKYIAQTNTKPPTFALFANRADDIPVSYERYLLNNFRKTFGCYGIPLRLNIRQRKNPYSNSNSRKH